MYYNGLVIFCKKVENIKLIVGLGNPGNKYEHTRHNVGFETIEKLVFDYKLKLKNKWRMRAQVAKSKDFILIKPQTYMNLSGNSVQAAIKFFKLDINSLIIIYDDTSLPLGSIRIRQNGSSGGQKGMEHIINTLGTTEIPRVRIGIGKKPDNMDLIDYVLSRFYKNEQEAMIKGITQAAEAAMLIVESGVINAMNKYNKKTTETL